jgi:hypothetical protein
MKICTLCGVPWESFSSNKFGAAGIAKARTKKVQEWSRGMAWQRYAMVS